MVGFVSVMTFNTWHDIQYRYGHRAKRWLNHDPTKGLGNQLGGTLLIRSSQESESPWIYYVAIMAS